MGDITWQRLLEDLSQAMLETGIMLGASLFLALMLGLPVGFALFMVRRGSLLEHVGTYTILGTVVNFVRSLPFVILLILVLPLARILTGHSTGPIAATVPLAIASIAFYARLVEGALCEVRSGLIQAAQALGASHWLIVREVLLPEAMPGLVRAFTVTAISLIGYSAMAGVVGGGGVGFLAINYGYYRYQTGVMVVTVLVMIALVQGVQWLGDFVAHRLERR
jgi:D-methionine transport system permease protein